MNNRIRMLVQAGTIVVLTSIFLGCGEICLMKKHQAMFLSVNMASLSVSIALGCIFRFERLADLLVMFRRILYALGLAAIFIYLLNAFGCDVFETLTLVFGPMIIGVTILKVIQERW